MIMAILHERTDLTTRPLTGFSPDVASCNKTVGGTRRLDRLLPSPSLDARGDRHGLRHLFLKDQTGDRNRHGRWQRDKHQPGIDDAKGIVHLSEVDRYCQPIFRRDHQEGSNELVPRHEEGDDGQCRAKRAVTGPLGRGLLMMPLADASACYFTTMASPLEIAAAVSRISRA